MMEPTDPRVDARRSVSRRRWVTATLAVVALLTVGVLSYSVMTGSPTEEAVPGRDVETVGTSGTTPADTGATSGPNAEDDWAFYPMRDELKAGDVVAYLDRQPLYLVDPTPVHVDDSQMVVEANANEENKTAANYMVYVPAASAPDSVSSRNYYLKAGDDQFIAVSLQPLGRGM
jgi:hypothetical protein